MIAHLTDAHLFHVSEQPDIAVFHPRPPPSPDAGVTEPCVWAIDRAHLANYMTPRDCPRVTFGRGPDTSADDVARFLGAWRGRIVVIEAGWLERLKDCRLFVYRFTRSADWRELPIGAGYHVSTRTQTPVDRIVIADAASAISLLGSELRVVEDLWPLIDAVAASSLDFSIIRKRNARVQTQ